MTHNSSLQQRFQQMPDSPAPASEPQDEEAIVVPPGISFESLVQTTEGWFQSKEEKAKEAEEHTHAFYAFLKQRGINPKDNYVNWQQVLHEFARERGIKGNKIPFHGPTMDHYDKMQKEGKWTHSKEDLDANVLATGPKAVACFDPSPDNAHAAAAAFHAIETRREGDVREQVEQTLEHLGGLRDEIDATNKAGGFTNISAAFAAMAVQAHTGRLGMDARELTASFESVMDGHGVTVSTEALDLALEGVDDVKKEFLKRGAATVHRALISNWKHARMYRVGPLEKLAKKAASMKGAAGSVPTIAVPSRLVMEGNKPAADIAKSFFKAVAVLQYMVKDFTKEAKADYSSNVDAVFEHVDYKAGKMLQPADMKTVLGKWKDPRTKIGDKASLPLIGNYKLFADQSPKYHGSDAVAKKFDELANQDYPTLIGFQHSSEKDESVGKYVQIPALTPKQVEDLSKLFLAAVKSVSFIQDLKENLAAFLTPINFPIKAIRRQGAAGVAGAVGIEKKSVEELKTVEDALKTSQRMCWHVGYDSIMVLGHIERAFTKVANLSLKAHAKATLESWDQASATDGVSVNETSPIEPTMKPNTVNQAPTGEVIPKQETFQDGKGGKQDLNGAVESTDNSPVEDLSKPKDLTTLTKGVEEVQPATAHTVGEGAATESTANSPVEDVNKTHDGSTIGTQVKEVAPATAATAQVVEGAKLTGADSSTTQVPPGKTDTTDAPNQTGDTEQSVKDAKLSGAAPTGFHQHAAADADKHADGKPVAAVKSTGGATDQSVDGNAALTGAEPTGVKIPDAQAHDKPGDHDVVDGVKPAVAATGKDGGPLKGAAPTGVDPKPAAPADKKADGNPVVKPMKPATESRVPYWFKAE
jgi:hypothetical protein